ALVAVAGEMDVTGDARQSRLEPQMIVVSDFQKGSRIDVLEAFEWPTRVPVEFSPVSPVQRTNASVHLVVDNEGTGDPSSMRVRVVNAADSTGDQFFVSFATVPPAGTGGSNLAGARPSPSPRPDEIAVYVPAGQSRVMKLPRSDQALTAERIVLRGDDHEFDNSYFVVPSRKQRAVILYAGSDAPTDPRGLLYYL